MFTRSKLCFLAVLFAAAPLSAKAAAIYDYTGNAYDAGGSPEFGTNLTAVVNFGNAVTGPNFTGSFTDNSEIQSFSLTSGSVTLSSATGATLDNNSFFNFNNGVITSWQLAGTDNTSIAMQT